MLSIKDLKPNKTQAVIRTDLNDSYIITGLDLSNNEEIVIEPDLKYPCVQSDFELDDEGRNMVLLHNGRAILVNSIDFDFNLFDS